MSTLKTLAVKYADEILTSRNFEDSFNRVKDSIDGLVYTETNQKISNNDKLTLWKEIKDNLRQEEGTVLLKEADNKQYLVLVNQVIAQLQQTQGGSK